MIVTITAYKRPALLQRCLESIRHTTPVVPFCVVVSTDWHSREMTERMSDAVRDSGLSGVIILNQDRRMGVANHPRWLFNSLVSRGQHYHFVALEEDTIVAPDCFLFAEWALAQPGFAFVNLADHKRKQVAHHTATMRVHQDWELRSPYGWAFTSDFWRVLEPDWNGKIRSPYGWDWQLSHLCYRDNWRSLTPEVARVYNTGRDEGTFDTPENWDRTQKDVRLCDELPGRYEIVRASARPEPPDWVKEEMRP